MGIYWQVFTMELRRQMSYRLDFWMNSLFAFMAAMAVVYYLWSSIYAGLDGGEIAGYSLNGMITYYLLVILIGRLVRGSQQLMAIANDIYDGGLSRYQLYPTSYLGFKYAEHLGNLLPVALQIALLAVVAPFFLDLPPEYAITPATLGTALLVVGLANLLYFLLALPLQLVAFWADNVWSLAVMLHFVGGLLGGVMLPLDLFPQGLREILYFTPFVYLYYFPVQVLLGQLGWAEIARGVTVMAFWLVILGSVARLIWLRGSRLYSGVGI
ncbi:MAG: ABC-2 family transporter protein [Thermodesulfobacteriota bacterium]